LEDGENHNGSILKRVLLQPESIQQ